MDEPLSLEVIRSVARFALKATSTSSSFNDFESTFDTEAAGGRPPIDESDPRIKKLVEQILFSRKFILTYYAVVAVVLITFIAVHQTTEIRRRRRRASRWKNLDTSRSAIPDEEEEEHDYNESGGSSSSSTLEGTASPPDKIPKGVSTPDEETPLLEGASKKTPKSTLSSKIRGLLMYQPADIAWLNVKFPPNVTSLAVIVFLAINVFYFFYHIPFTLPMIFVFSDRAALMFVANLPVLYLLSAKNQPLKWLVGVSYESLNIFHRRLGELMVLLALIHTAGVFAIWYTILRKTGFTLAKFLSTRIIILGLCAFVTYDTIYLTSTATFRLRWYELFLGLHVILQSAALVLLFFHHPHSRIYVGVALAIFVIDRLVIRMTLKTKTVRTSLKVMDDKETVQLSSDKVVEEQKGLLKRLARPDLSNGWNPTDHVFLTIPSLSRRHAIQTHPFTIASPASRGEKSCFKLIIRAKDGFSKDLLRFAKGHDQVVARLDGPYGAESSVKFIQEKDIAVIVAGGSGIAVALPLAWSLIRSVDPEATTTGRHPQRILLVWVFHDRKNMSWVDQEDLDGLIELGVDFKPCLGRQDIGEMIQGWTEKANLAMFRASPSIGVVVSGPDGMNRDVRNSCAAMAFSGQNVSVKVEKYGW